MRIGIDIDDTICETWEYVKPIYKKHFNLSDEELNKNKYSRVLKCTIDEYYDFYKKIISPLLINVPIKKDAVKYINKLKEEGNEIYFITARSTFDMYNPYELTKQYLENNNIKYDKLLVNSLKKEQVAKDNNIDIFIDDSIKHCTNVSKEGIKVFLMDNIYNKNCNDFPKVKNWKQLYEKITLN